MEGDANDTQMASYAVDFNPLPPHGGRQIKVFDDARKQDISIHSLRMEGDEKVG